mmetsp:Transcript_5215/g.9350  ORF Transcript_5215/g.9350 Transcript_5215/m.9350 type:complete len:226 (+) Transcript_5215:4608-5285(+)
MITVFLSGCRRWSLHGSCWLLDSCRLLLLGHCFLLDGRSCSFLLDGRSCSFLLDSRSRSFLLNSWSCSFFLDNWGCSFLLDGWSRFLLNDWSGGFSDRGATLLGGYSLFLSCWRCGLLNLRDFLRSLLLHRYCSGRRLNWSIRTRCYAGITAWRCCRLHTRLCWGLCTDRAILGCSALCLLWDLCLTCGRRICNGCILGNRGFHNWLFCRRCSCCFLLHLFRRSS